MCPVNSKHSFFYGAEKLERLLYAAAGKMLPRQWKRKTAEIVMTSGFVLTE